VGSGGTERPAEILIVIIVVVPTAAAGTSVNVKGRAKDIAGVLIC
jgi:hypothetical protein